MENLLYKKINHDNVIFNGQILYNNDNFLITTPKNVQEGVRKG